MVASETASSCGPQPNAQPPPIAQAPNPVLVIKAPLEPSGRCGRGTAQSSVEDSAYDYGQTHISSPCLDGHQLCACVRFDSHSLLRFTVAAPVWLAERVCHARGIGCGLVDSAAYGHVFEQARTPDRRQTVLPVFELFYR